jgi:hypothetical protein
MIVKMCAFDYQVVKLVTGELGFHIVVNHITKAGKNLHSCVSSESYAATLM